MSIDLTARLNRIVLKNPILVASGTFGYARELAGLVDCQSLGAIIPKTITSQPRAGNPPPRTVETACGLLNSIGLDNDGIDHFLSVHLPHLVSLGTAIIPNLAGKNEDEFALLAKRIPAHENIAAIELNLSCPNVAGGLDFATHPEVTERIVRAVRNQTDHPVIAKLTPNVSDPVSIAQAAAAGGAEALSLVNTFLGMAIDWRARKPVLGNGMGGLSGPAIKPLVLRIVWQVARAISIPLIAVGGIATIDDVMEFLMAGASAIQIGTANFYDPTVSQRLISELPGALSSIGLVNWMAGCGLAHRSLSSL